MGQGGARIVTGEGQMMEIPVLIEPLPNGKGFRAKTGEPLSLSAEGTTRDDALSQLQSLTSGRLATGAEIVPMAVKTGNPWVDLAGFLPDDELTREWMDILRENRKKANESVDGLLPGV
jgi:hypothetical protein